MSEKQHSRKINIGPLPAQSQDFSRFEETTLRWDRIGLAGAIVIAILYGLYSLVFNDKEEQNLNTGALAEVQASSDQEVANKAASPVTPAPSIEKTLEESPSPITSETGVTDKPSKEGEASEQIVEPNQILADAANSDEQFETTKPTEEKLIERTSSTSSQNAPIVSIYHKGITQAQLTSKLKDGMPVDKLGAAIKMNEEGIIKVVLFTEMTDIRGMRTRHIWYRNGVKQATINVPVNANLQRSSSSKFINFQMLGDWQVRVVDDIDALLAEANFQVGPYQ